MVEFEEQAAYPHHFGEERSAFGFGGMGGEDEFDVQAAEEGRHLFGGDALVFKRHEGIFNGIRGYLHPLFSFANSMDTFVFFGKVDEVEVEGKRGGDGAGLFRVEGGDFGGEAGFGVGDTRAPVFGGLADAFFGVEEGGGFLITQDLAEEVAEEVDGGGEGHGGEGEIRY